MQDYLELSCPHLQVHDGKDGHYGGGGKETSDLDLASGTGVSWDNWVGRSSAVSAWTSISTWADWCIGWDWNSRSDEGVGASVSTWAHWVSGLLGDGLGGSSDDGVDIDGALEGDGAAVCFDFLCRWGVDSDWDWGGVDSDWDWGGVDNSWGGINNNWCLRWNSDSVDVDICACRVDGVGGVDSGSARGGLGGVFSGAWNNDGGGESLGVGLLSAVITWLGDDFSDVWNVAGSVWNSDNGRWVSVVDWGGWLALFLSACGRGWVFSSDHRAGVIGTIWGLRWAGGFVAAIWNLSGSLGGRAVRNVGWGLRLIATIWNDGGSGGWDGTLLFCAGARGIDWSN